MKSFTTNGFVKRSLSILLSFALILSFLPSLGNTKQVQAEEAQTAVEQGGVKSEEEIIEQADGVPVSPEDEQGNLFSGGIHRLFDRSDINYKNNANNGTTKNGTLSSTLPSQVDLRNFNGQNRVRSVKNQASTGGCWSFAANAVSETSIATSLNAAAQTDYSTLQTHYFVYDSLSSNTAQLKGSEVSQAGEGIKWASDALKKEYLLMCGGTTYHASSVFMQGVGPANATEIPFTDTSGELTTTLTPANRRSCLAHLSKWSYLGSLITTKLDASGNTTYDSTDETVLNNAKTELANGNPIELTYCGDNRSSWGVQYYINTDTYAQYTYEYQSPNHAVCVVGYDDNYSKDNFISGHQPDRDGAFIVKNSWGSDWGNSGYFYLSYWDQSITDLTTYVYDTSNYDGSNIDVDKEEVIDQYDYMAADDIYKPGSQTGIAEWYSNVFTASKNQSLHSIGTYYCSNGQNLSYKVYKLKSNATSPSDVEGTLATPAAQGTYSNPYEGYVSIDLATPVELKKGDKYAIWISQKDDDGDYCAPQTMAWASGDDLSNNTHIYDVNAVVNTGESFFRASGSSTWTGFSTEQIGPYVFDNYCVKGYSTVKPYEVNFYSNGYLYSNRQAYDGETVTLPYANPDKTGYWFAGWYKDEACTQAWNSSSAITEDTNLYAKFNPNVYYVWFYDGYTTFDTQQIEYNSYATEPDPAPTKAGYHFDGWYTEDGSTDGNWGTKFECSSTPIREAKSLYAKWSNASSSYTVTFKDWNGTTLKTETVQAGNSATAPSSPTRTGYTFTGWDKSFTNVTSNMTVTAQYTINSYTVTFNTNGGSAVVAKTVEHGSKVAKPTPDPTKVGYTFDGWYSNSALTSRYDFNTAVASSFTLYAKWSVSIPSGGTRVLTHNHVYFINSYVTGKPMEIGGGRTDNGAGVNQYILNNTPAQQWKVTYDSDNYATFTNVNSGKVLDVSGGNAYSGAKVQQYGSNGSNAQKWKVEKSGNQYTIRSKVNNNYVLDLSGASRNDGAQIWLYGSNNSSAQRWTVYDITLNRTEVANSAKNNSSVVSAGTYVITSKLARNKVVDVFGGSKNNGANVQLYQSNNTNAQKWTVSFDSNGYATIKNTSGKVLDISCGSTTPGANVQQYQSNNSAAQKWVFVKNPNGSIKIQSALFPNLVLDVSGGSSANGANIQVYSDNGSVAQQWAFAAV